MGRGIISAKIGHPPSDKFRQRKKERNYDDLHVLYLNFQSLATKERLVEFEKQWTK